MTNSHEVVLKTLAFEHPARVARSFKESDLLGVECTARTCATDWVEVRPGLWEHIDEWGNLWQRLDPTSKGEVKKGILDDLKHMDSLEFPDFSKPEDYEKARQVRQANPDLWIIGNLPGFTFNIARKLRRIDFYLMDIVTERDTLRILHDRIDALLLTMIENFARVGVDAVMFPEDWGTQQQTFINPILWKDEFFPRFKKLCGRAHDHGLSVFMHSCGKIGAIIPGLIEAGIDLLQFDQPELHGLDFLASFQENHKITYWCPVDVQKVLPTGDENLIRNKAREMMAKLWRGRGGFVAGFYGDMPSIGVQPEWQEWACEEFSSYQGAS